MRGKYKYLEKTADAKFQAFGKTIEEAFANAALAMFNLMFETEKVKTKIRKRFNIETKDFESLLYNFLEELLFLRDSSQFALHRVEEVKINEKKGKYYLNASVVGDNASKYKAIGEVKAVTYNEMFVKQEENKTTVQVVVDL